MPTDYLPRTDAGLLAFAQNFSTKITATPTVYGLTAALATSYASKLSAYTSALTAATDPSTRGPHNVLLKDQARHDLVQITRQYGPQVQGTITVTNTQRQELGLSVRVIPQPHPIPAKVPDIDIVAVNGRNVRIRISDPSGTERGKPLGVDGIAVFSYVGATAPSDTDPWVFQGNTTRTVVDVSFPMSLPPGTQVWLTAFYFNEKKQSGAACTPVGVNLGGGGAMPIAA